MKPSAFITKYHHGVHAVWFERIPRTYAPPFTHAVIITCQLDGQARPQIVHKDWLDAQILRPGPKAAGFYLEKYSRKCVPAIPDGERGALAVDCAKADADYHAAAAAGIDL